MENHLYLQDFDEEDLISFEDKEKIYRFGKIKSSCRKSIENKGKTAQGFSTLLSELTINSLEWMEQGVQCETLRLGEKEWVKGHVKVRIVVEFCPDQEGELSSELDTFRE
jgi:KGK domain